MDTTDSATLALINALSIKPSQRSPEDVEQLVALLEEHPFFAGVEFSNLKVLAGYLTLQRAAPGEALLHHGELTDRLYLLLSGRCSLVRHSRREGHQPREEEVAPGQALSEGSLVLSGRPSDISVKISAEAAPAAGGSGGGAAFAVLTRTSFSNLSARAPSQPECQEARLALLTCMARSLAAASEPGRRTQEQAEDLGAVLKQLPGLASAAPPVIKALSEAASLRRLPAGTVLYEEHTRAESQFVVLSGAVQERIRPRRDGATNRAALRSALKSAVAASRAKSAGRLRPGATGADTRTVKQKIEDERKSREAIRQSLALQREGLRSPPRKQTSMKPVRAKAVEDEFKKWMLEFLQRKRGGAGGSAPGFATSPRAVPAAEAAPAAKAVNAWKRAAFVATHSGEASGDGGVMDEPKDAQLLEYERRKREEEAGYKGVGGVLGGAAAANAYARGLKPAGGSYSNLDDADGHGDGEHVRFGGASPAGADAGKRGAHDEGLDDVQVNEDDEEEEPWVRLTYLDRHFHIKTKPIRYIDAVERVMGLASPSPKRAAGSLAAGAGSPAAAGAGPRIGADAASAAAGGGGGGGGNGGGGGGEELVLDEGSGGAAGAEADAGGADVDDDFIDADDASPQPSPGRGRGGAAAAAAAAAGAAAAAPDGSEEAEPAEDEHLEQLYGPVSGRVEPGALAGELPPAALDRALKPAQRPKRAHSAVAGMDGADVLLVTACALRRGAEAVRSDLIAERLAVLGALEPLRGLSEEHQAAVALGAAVVVVDSNALIVRQAQLVDALYVVLEGEVRLLDDSDSVGGSGGGAGPPALAASPLPNGGGGLERAATFTNSASLMPLPSDTSPRTGGGAGGAAAGGSGVSSTSTGAQLTSIKARRAAAALSTLSLLGPGGSFGESVLGYPADLAKARRVAAGPSRGAVGPPGNEVYPADDDTPFPPSTFLATAVAARQTRLLVLPRQLLGRYGYLRIQLPPFAEARREALTARRSQLRSGLLLPSASFSSNLSVATPTPQASGLSPLPALLSPQHPRPPATVRPLDILESMGFRAVKAHRTNSNVGAVAPNIRPSGGSFPGVPGLLSGSYASAAAAIVGGGAGTNANSGSGSLLPAVVVGGAVAPSGGSFSAVIEKQREPHRILPLVRQYSGGLAAAAATAAAAAATDSTNSPIATGAGMTALAAAAGSGSPLPGFHSGGAAPAAGMGGAGAPFKPRAMRSSVPGVGQYVGAGGSVTDAAATAALLGTPQRLLTRRSSLNGASSAPSSMNGTPMAPPISITTYVAAGGSNGGTASPIRGAAGSNGGTASPIRGAAGSNGGTASPIRGAAGSRMQSVTNAAGSITASAGIQIPSPSLPRIGGSNSASAAAGTSLGPMAPGGGGAMTRVRSSIAGDGSLLARMELPDGGGSGGGSPAGGGPHSGSAAHPLVIRWESKGIRAPSMPGLSAPLQQLRPLG
ncbi:hypothetical protein HYH02_009662 [Chlamydomonas schloesseri]|uniref:Cyclic nucleotide-binding domain-containing protein n=1 Tax=Chlamydomonas schloesseri TaxID=2026947 RepID=A0A835TKF8_9CHLO|nr:hypothetical protein HYH02_009662 [Chlamydomonas schloesseri]|eukprot:KAG2442174.1 hypothetical protein HYH02_009662 [Chlamydomonas schloesseri]